jgi:hypothetical protein
MKMWLLVIVLAVGLTRASVNVTFLNHSHVAVTSVPSLYTVDLHVEQALALDFSTDPIGKLT